MEEPERSRRVRICAGELGPGDTGSELKWTDLVVGGGCDDALRWSLGRDGDWARGVFTPADKSR